MAYDIRPWDREWFKRCRRAFDLGSRSRRNLDATVPMWKVDVDRAVRDALAVYYFPGMWEWDRHVVLPLTFQAFDRAMAGQRDLYVEEAELSATQAEEWEQGRARGRTLLERYLEWAPTVDRFWPVRVETDFDVQVPDPRRPGHDLVSPDGEPIHYQGRVDLLVVDEHDAYWMVRHRVVDDFTHPDLLRLDDELVAACFAWEIFYLGMRIAGTVHNELRPGSAPPDQAVPAGRPRASHAFARARAASRDEGGGKADPAESPGEQPALVAGHRRMYARSQEEPHEVLVQQGGDMFRRTRLPRSREELDRLGSRLALEALDMTNPDLVFYPTPGEHCSECTYRPPCLAMHEGGGVEEVVSAGYRTRPPEVPEEGRLGGVTWSMNRGAAPPPQWREKRPMTVSPPISPLMGERTPP